MKTTEKLISLTNEVVQARQSLLDKLANSEEELKEVIKQFDLDTLEKFDYDQIGIRLLGNNSGMFYHIVYNSDYDTKILPYDSDKIGDDLYYNGDFNMPIFRMNRDEVLHVANNLQSFINNMIDVLENLKKEEQITIPEIIIKENQK